MKDTFCTTCSLYRSAVTLSVHCANPKCRCYFGIPENSLTKMGLNVVCPRCGTTLNVPPSAVCPECLRFVSNAERIIRQHNEKDIK